MKTTNEEFLISIYVSTVYLVSISLMLLCLLIHFSSGINCHSMVLQNVLNRHFCLMLMCLLSLRGMLSTSQRSKNKTSGPEKLWYELWIHVMRIWQQKQWSWNFPLFSLEKGEVNQGYLLCFSFVSDLLAMQVFCFWLCSFSIVCVYC